jgi:hypothetical protein
MAKLPRNLAKTPKKREHEVNLSHNRAETTIIPAEPGIQILAQAIRLPLGKKGSKLPAHAYDVASAAKNSLELFCQSATLNPHHVLMYTSSFSGRYVPRLIAIPSSLFENL